MNCEMGKHRKSTAIRARKMINKKTDPRIKAVQEKAEKKREEAVQVRNVQQTASSLFFRHNTALVPPFEVLLDTNFINFSLQNKLDIVSAMMDCLYAEVRPCVSECVLAELEKLGPKYRLALRLARDPRFTRLPCCHSGTYADDCIVSRVTQHRCYIVATCDRALKARLRRIPGVPIMYISGRKYSVEQMPEAFNCV